MFPFLVSSLQFTVYNLLSCSCFLFASQLACPFYYCLSLWLEGVGSFRLFSPFICLVSTSSCDTTLSHFTHPLINVNFIIFHPDFSSLLSSVLVCCRFNISEGFSVHDDEPIWKHCAFLFHSKGSFDVSTWQSCSPLGRYNLQLQFFGRITSTRQMCIWFYNGPFDLLLRTNILADINNTIQDRNAVLCLRSFWNIVMIFTWELMNWGFNQKMSHLVTRKKSTPI